MAGRLDRSVSSSNGSRGLLVDSQRPPRVGWPAAPIAVGLEAASTETRGAHSRRLCRKLAMGPCRRGAEARRDETGSSAESAYSVMTEVTCGARL